jgi:hypothetical protein
MCLRVSYNYFASLKSLKKGVGSGSVSQRIRIRTKMSQTTLFRRVRRTRIIEVLPNILKGAEKRLKFDRGIVVVMTWLPPSLLHLLNTHTQAYDRMLIVTIDHSTPF